MADTKTFPTNVVNGRVSRAQKPKGEDGKFAGFKGAMMVGVHLSAFDDLKERPFLRTKQKGGIWSNVSGGLFVAEFRLPKEMPKEALLALNEGRGKDDPTDVEVTFVGDIVTEVTVFIDEERSFTVPCGKPPKAKAAKNEEEE